MNFQSSRRQDDAAMSAEVRVLTKRYGSLLGVEFDIAVADRYFRVGELTKTRLEKETPVDLGEWDLLEIDENGDPIEEIE
jgi:hypothetical protein